MRSIVIFFILMNYLAVLLGSAVMVQKPVHIAGHPFVHAEDCQQRHYLALDCWDKCNGESFLQDASPKVPVTEAIVFFSGLDVHDTPHTTVSRPTSLISSHSKFPSCFSSCFKGFDVLVLPPPELG